MSEPCAFCGGPCNPYDESTYKEVAGWVHGKKSDSMTLRDDTGRVAHEKCVLKAKQGQAPDQPDLFGEDTVVTPEESQADLEKFIDEMLPPPTVQSLGKMLKLVQEPDPRDFPDPNLPF